MIPSVKLENLINPYTSVNAVLIGFIKACVFRPHLKKF